MQNAKQGFFSWACQSMPRSDKLKSERSGAFYEFLLFFFCFRRQDPVTFEGDLTNDEAILNWLTSQEVFSIGDEIEEVNRKMLEKLLEENDFVAVYFCKYCYS